MYNIRFELNIDVIKRDIEPETVERIIREILKSNLPRYIEFQSLIVEPRFKK